MLDPPTNRQQEKLLLPFYIGCIRLDRQDAKYQFGAVDFLAKINSEPGNI